MVSDNIKRIRKERGLTQKRLGELCGIAEPNIRKYENGKQNPKMETIEKIASALGVTPFDLMGFDYWDQKLPNAGKTYLEYEGLLAYLKELGYSVITEPNGNEAEGAVSAEYNISGNGISVCLSDVEFGRLQSSSADLVYSFLWKKQHENK